MEKRGPVFEKSRSVENVYHMRLAALLRELVRDGGFKGAAKALGLDQRTVAAAYRSGSLSRRVRTALERGLQSGEGSAAAVQRERNDALEGRLGEVEGTVEELGKDVSKGLAAVGGDMKALRSEHDGGMRRLAQLESGRTAQGEGAEENMAGGRTKRRGAPWREYPDLVTLEPAEDDEAVFGEAWPLVVEWRGLKNAHPNRGKGLAWLRDEERLLMMELALLEEHGMTLPPEKQPLRDFARNGQINWRRTALYDTRRALAWRELLRRVGRVLTPGFWRK